MGTKTRRSIRALTLLLTAAFCFSGGAAFAAAPNGEVNAAYDLQITTDWDSEDGLTIVPAGETVLLAADWHNGFSGAGSDTWIPGGSIEYAWRSDNEELAAGITQIPSWYDPAPEWDPEEQIEGSFASVLTSADNLGIVGISCTAAVDPAYELTGRTEASAELSVAGLAAEESSVRVRLGETISLSAFWTVSEEFSRSEAQQFFETSGTDMQLWDGSQDAWSVAALITPLGTEVDGEEALFEAAGPFVPDRNGAFGCRAAVTPQQPGTYTFVCEPVFGTRAALITAEVLSGEEQPQFGACVPESKQVLVPAAAEEDKLSQQFSVEVDAGYNAEGRPAGGSVCWSLSGADGSDVFFENAGALRTSEVFLLEMNDSLLREDGSAELCAWLVPDGTDLTADAVREYGRLHPESVHEWELIATDEPALVTTEESSLDIEGEYIFGLTADVAGRNPAEEVLSQLCWNAGSRLQILRPDGSELGSDESVGTADTLRMHFPDTRLPELEAVFVVAGDITGTGTVTVTDVVRMAGALRSPGTLEGPYLLAADFTETGNITVSDLVREAALLRASQAGPSESYRGRQCDC